MVNVDGKCRHYRTVWFEGGRVFMIDQPRLPHDFSVAHFDDYVATASAIKDMVVRGAGAIGATGGFAMAQAALAAPEDGFLNFMVSAKKIIDGSRPTAQDLFYATGRVFDVAKSGGDVSFVREKCVLEAQKIADENASACEMIGMHGSELIKDGMKILTHCNAGWLAFVDWGSALSPIYAAKRAGRNVFVYADETRPRCQGARLTAFELMGEGVDCRVIADNTSGYLMRKGEVDMVIVGADRIAANGDVANKIGTYEKAVLAHENGIPFYVAAPLSTFDMNCVSGDDIPIEERSEDEVNYMFGWSDELSGFSKVRITPERCRAFNPAFDVTPAKYVSGIITEKGVFKASRASLKMIFEP